MMRIYEEMFIVRPDATDEVIDPIIDALSKFITGHGGTVDKVDKWGKRRLAYRVDKSDEGFYVLMQFTGTPDTVKELERRLRVNDLVIKFLTTRIDERLKVAEKRKKKAEKRAARKPPPSPVTPAIPAAMPGAALPAGPAPGAPAPALPMPAAPAPAAAEAAPVEAAPAAEAVPVVAAPVVEVVTPAVAPDAPVAPEPVVPEKPAE